MATLTKAFDLLSGGEQHGDDLLTPHEELRGKERYDKGLLAGGEQHGDELLATREAQTDLMPAE